MYCCLHLDPKAYRYWEPASAAEEKRGGYRRCFTFYYATRTFSLDVCIFHESIRVVCWTRVSSVVQVCWPDHLVCPLLCWQGAECVCCPINFLIRVYTFLSPVYEFMDARKACQLFLCASRRTRCPSAFACLRIQVYRTFGTGEGHPAMFWASRARLQSSFNQGLLLLYGASGGLWNSFLVA